MQISWWTLGLQAVNVLILVWILARFFYRPVANIIEERRAAAAKLLVDASAAREAVAKEKTDIAATRAGFAAERAALLERAAKDAEAERARTLRAANDAIAKLRAENEAALVQDRKIAEHDLIARAAALGVDIARKLLDKLPADASAEVFLAAMARQIEALPERSRAMLSQAAAAKGLEVVSAAPLDEAQRKRCGAILESVLGAVPRLQFRTDPSLLAGMEILGDTIALRNNWRDDLAAIRQILESDA